MEEARVYNILLVEDAEDNRKLIELYFRKLPEYSIDMAENGLIGLDKFKDKKYDAVLMDIQMPVMDGHTSTRLMREWEHHNNMVRIPIIAVTANAFKEDEERSYKAGCDAFLTKPIKKALLVEVLENLIFKSSL